MMPFLLLLIVVSSAASGAGLERRSFLTAFPVIAYDDHKVVFANEQWAAVYSGKAGAMFTVPRDSVEMPVPRSTGRGCSAIVGNATYVCNPIRGNSIVKQDAYGNAEKIIPPPNDQSLQALADAWKQPDIARGEVSEEIGPLAESPDKVWFGLLAFHGRGEDPVAGLGWYDVRTEQFGRVYSSALQNLAPRWVGLRADTVWVYCAATGAEAGGKLVTFSIRDGALGLVNPLGYGVPGDTLLNVDLWRGFLLVSTEQSVSIWPQGERPWVWQTDAYASRSRAWLKFMTFDTQAGLTYVGDDFFPLQPNQPAQAFARIGDWVELYAPRGIEATLPTEEWSKRKKKLQGDDWGCGGKLCFSRVQVNVSGVRKSMDLLDTPLALIEEGDAITKVGMRAGWAPIYDLVPVLMKK
ncbi:MAG: hypothetical protein IPH10_10900 [bacterium]|nr:hypothetical protein [bacterium]